MPKDQRAEPSLLGLQRIKLLEGLAVPALEQLARQCRWRRYAPEETIISRDARTIRLNAPASLGRPYHPE